MVAEVVGKEDPRDLVTSTGMETKRMAINLQDLEVNRWDGKTFVQSHFDISRVRVDSSLKEIQDFRNRYTKTP
ncbi:hypothetical protein PIB30_091066 [Stylosanthes scabra]|uniref:Uncharacterized protein n=1 Tax=Stylosanthes scabra TaxID=79078 RepID=A0ABU6SUV2_9FABA|nr:hypothetical protein [Stylosanthes scabra]